MHAGLPAAQHAWLPPLVPDRAIERAFERPLDRFAAGHRGTDWPARAGEDVHAVAAGRISHVGEVAGVPSVTVDHGILRSSYLPVESDLVEGQSVAAGEVIGVVSSVVTHCSRSCLHLGIRTEAFDARDARADPYLDPLAWISRTPVLKPVRGNS